MNIFKKLAAAGMFAMLVFAPSGGSAAGFGFKVGAATVDDVTTSACTTAKGQSIDMFGNGVSMDQVWRLEIETGSKGSGTWSAVPGFSDVFPTIQGSAAVGGPVQVVRTTSDVPGNACYRLRMTTDGGGTGQIQIVTDRGKSTDSMTTASHMRAFDEFQHGTVPITTTHNGNTPSYVLSNTSTGTNVIPVIEAGQEGLLTASSGEAGTSADLIMASYGLATNGTLVSSGLQIVEWRMSMSQITDARVQFGLGNVIANATEFELFKCNTNVCAESTGAGSADAAVFLFDTDSADAQTDMWNAVSMLGSALGNVADEYTLGASPVASTFAVFRIEVESTGDAFWYYNGVLVGAEPLAVATTAVLIPILISGSPDDGTGTTNKIYVDYLLYWSPRTAT